MLAIVLTVSPRRTALLFDVPAREINHPAAIHTDQPPLKVSYTSRLGSIREVTVTPVARHSPGTKFLSPEPYPAKYRVDGCNHPGGKPILFKSLDAVRNYLASK